MTWINTFSGVKFDFNTLAPSQFRIVDMVAATARICRFTGHSLEHYSVGEHQMHTADIVSLRGGSLVEQKWALIHDMSEGYMSDLNHPLKRSGWVPGYLTKEKEVMDCIAKKFSLPTEQPEAVHKADRDMFSLEIHDRRIVPNPQNEMIDFWKQPDDAEALQKHVRVQCLPAPVVRATLLNAIAELWKADEEIVTECLEAHNFFLDMQSRYGMPAFGGLV